MEQRHKQRIAELEARLVVLHRSEMRFRSVLASALVSPEKRAIAREELEALLKETREIEETIRVLETDQ